MTQSWKDLEENGVKDGPLGIVEYLTHFHSSRLKYPRDVIIWLPPSYHRAHARKYPVLYLQDGQNLMDPNTAFLGVDWDLDRTAYRLIRQKKMTEIIMVGIYNTPDREKEYTATAMGRSYAWFVINELKPFVDSTYRTKPGRQNTAVMGSSLGGLISFLFAWWYPNIFSKAACLSSSFLWNHNQILEDVRKQDKSGKKPIQIYLDVGSKEPMLRKGYHRMVRLLKQNGYSRGSDLQYYLDRSGSHNESSWGKRAWRPLQFLFPPRQK